MARYDEGLRLDPILVQELNRICSETGASVIISSSWRLRLEESDMAKKLLLAGLSALFIGYTEDGDNRADQIISSVFSYTPESWVVIDDRHVDIPIGRLIRTNGFGITSDDANDAISILINSS